MRRFFWTLGQLESGRPLKAVDLARQFEVGLRTAYRDLDFLRDEWRVPVEYDRRRGSYVLTGPTYGLPHVTLTEGELLGLFFAEKVVHQYRGTPYEADLVSALRKILEFLPEQVRVAPGPLDAFLSLELGPIAAPDAEVFRQVVEALTRRRRALVRYASASSGGTADRKVDPYRLYNLRGDWYLAAHDSIANPRQHPLGSAPGAGLGPEQRAAFNQWRVEYWKARAAEELARRNLK